MAISHEPKLLYQIRARISSCTDKRLVYAEDNSDAFVEAKGIMPDDAEAPLSSGEGEGKAASGLRRPWPGPAIRFSVPGSLEGVGPGSRTVAELRASSSRGKDKDRLVSGCSGS